MKGLPRAESIVSPRDCWNITVLGGIERLTESLRRGDPHSAQSLADMRELRNRLKAFSDALEAREAMIDDGA
jgi:hypothetical protein